MCSVCGVDNRKMYCEHYNGREYDGKTCFFALGEPKDAYEVSFVAVPAQKDAGVTKNYTGEEKTYDETKQLNKQKEDLIDADIALVKSFIFTENERG